MSIDLVTRLAKLDTCAVSDALERCGLPPAVVGLREIGARKPFAGRAVTVQLGPVGEGDESSRHLGTAAIDESGAGDVIVMANDGRVDCAGWGGLLSQAAALRGIEGVIVDGACRDVTEAVEAGLPVSARAAVAVTARGRVAERSWGEPVTIAALRVERGDLVAADASGVAFIPAHAADRVLTVAEQIARRERAMSAELRAGSPVSEVMGRSYEEMVGHHG